jgi:hypothetical protein
MGSAKKTPSRYFESTSSRRRIGASGPFPSRIDHGRDCWSLIASGAAATCKADGVTDPKLLDDCVLDVAETGQTDHATAFSRTLPPGSCVIDTVSEDGVQFVHESLDQFEAGHPGSVGSGPVNSLGHDAYCVVRPSLTPNQSDVVLSIGRPGILSILADNCADATELSVDALAHVSGL